MDIEKLLAELTESWKETDAEIAAFAATDWFKDYPPAAKALTSGSDAEQLAALQDALAAGADPEATAPDGTSAAKLALNMGNLAALKMLQGAGAGFANCHWTPLHRAVLFGSPGDVLALATPETAAALDAGSRSPLLLACLMGQTEAAQILWPLTPPAARENPKNREENALILAATHGTAGLVIWLLDQGALVDWPDAYGGTALLAAVGTGDCDLVEALLRRGANPNPQQNVSASQRDREPVAHAAIAIADKLMESVKALMPEAFREDDPKDDFNGPFSYELSPRLVRLLIEYGYPLDQVPDEHFAVATGADLLPDPAPSAKDILDHGRARTGIANPQRVDFPFWMSQIRTGQTGYLAADAILGDAQDHPNPVWSFQRYGRSITRLTDGRIVCVAGEHEDHYDSDFCIYADVTVLDGKGGVEHYIYPSADFPPTDFHTATLVGNTIWLIGNLGFQGARGDKAQVLALSTKDWSVRPVQTNGDDPGWISKHKAIYVDGQIVVSNGAFPPDFRKAAGCWSLDLTTRTWRKIGEA